MPLRLLRWFPLLVACASACATRPSHLVDAHPQVIVKTVRLPDRSWLPWYTRFAEHTWVEIADAAGRERIEWNKGWGTIVHSDLDADEMVGAAADERWERDVAVLAQWHGERAAAIAARIRAVADHYPHAAHYRAWPGPNSNTFVAWLAREAGFGVDLPGTAVGKDYTPWVDAGVSTTGVGLHVDTVVLGVQAGLVEGLELHLLGLTAGVGLWPPCVKLPFLPAIPGGWFAP